MQNSKRLVEKRRLGPALQWAKSRAKSECMHNQTRRRINIDLDLEDKWDDLQTEPGTSSQDRSFQQHHVEYWEPSHQVSTNAPTNSYYNRGPWLGEPRKLQHNKELNDGSAWDYYSGQHRHDSYKNSVSGASPHVQNNLNGYNSAAHKSAEGSNTVPRQNGLDRGNKRHGPGLRQLLPAIIVAAVIFLVGLLSSLG